MTRKSKRERAFEDEDESLPFDEQPENIRKKFTIPKDNTENIYKVYSSLLYYCQTQGLHMLDNKTGFDSFYEFLTE